MADPRSPGNESKTDPTWVKVLTITVVIVSSLILLAILRLILIIIIAFTS